MLTHMPNSGTDWETLKRELIELKWLDLDWRRGRLPAYIYFYDEELLRIQTEAYALYAVENALGEGKVFQSLTAMLKDISAMAFDLYHAPPGAGMSFTSGGTESIFEAVKTARKRFRTLHPQRRGRANVVAPVSAHATLDKAGEILDVDIVRVGLGSDYRGDAAAMAAAVNQDTLMLFASAPCFPYGVFDPIEALGRQETFTAALRVLRPGGTLSSLGVYSSDLTIPLDAFAAGLGDHTIVTSLCPGGKERMARLMDVIASARLDTRPLVTHRFRLDDIEAAYDLFANQRDGVLKIAITA